MTAKKSVPGPRGSFFLGSLKERRDQPLKLFIESARKYGKIIRFRLGFRHIHLLNDPEYIKYVLMDNQKNFIKGSLYDGVRLMLGRGLLTSNGTTWRKQRKLAQPAFHMQKLQAIAAVMGTAADQTALEWAAWAKSGAQLDLASEMMKLSLKIAGLSLLGVDLSGQSQEIGRALTFAIEEITLRNTSIPLPYFLPTPRNLRLRKSINQLDRVIYQIIEHRKNSAESCHDLLSMLMDSKDEDGNGMTPKELRDEVMTLFVAGYETSATSLSWTLYLLSQHPEVERRLRNELASVLGGKTPSFMDLDGLNYLEQVIQEGLRLYPPIWVIPRNVVEDDVIGGYRIPAGTVVTISSYVIHRNPEIWENPDQFDPDRFTEERSAGRHKYAYIPFSAGPRQCIGMSFAMMEMKLILATLLQKFQIQMVPGFEVVPAANITLRPKDGVLAILKAVEASQVPLKKIS